MRPAPYSFMCTASQAWASRRWSQLSPTELGQLARPSFCWTAGLSSRRTAASFTVWHRPSALGHRLWGLSRSGLGRWGPPVVLVLDTYEVFRFLDTWLRETFLPSLGANVRLVLAGREPPVMDWLASARWHALVRSVALEPLGDAAALELLSRNGVGEREALRINRFVHGHPLALRLAAATLSERPDRSLEGEAIPMVVASLARMYLADVGDPVTRAALNAAASVRRVTRSLLRAMLPDAAPDDAFERLQALPFVYSGSDGL